MCLELPHSPRLCIPSLVAPSFTSATWSPSCHHLYYYFTRTSLPILPSIPRITASPHDHDHHTHDHRPPMHTLFHWVSVAPAFFYAFTTATDEEATCHFNIAVFLRLTHTHSYFTSWLSTIKNEMRLSSTPPSLCFTTACHQLSGPYKERAGQRGLCVISCLTIEHWGFSYLLGWEMAREEWMRLGLKNVCWHWRYSSTILISDANWRAFFSPSLPLSYETLSYK